MKINDLLKTDECRPLFDEVNIFCSKILKDYLVDLKELNRSVKYGKDIFDFVWGTVELTPFEVLLLDSPLLQRLRYIKQLGMADMLYCNATSNRFSHTIGVIEVSSRMTTKVTRGLGIKYGERGEIIFREIVRLAALFHDVGHMFFSHVSEIFFSQESNLSIYKDVCNAVNQMSTKTGMECHLHEVISVMIVNSDAVRALLLQCNKCVEQPIAFLLQSDEDAHQLQEYISALILGVAIDQMILPFSNIINGPVDADKIDYLSRDSACTKVPISVDAARLIQKIEVTAYNAGCDEPGYINKDVWENDSEVTTRYFDGISIDDNRIMVIKNSATKVCYQLTNARQNMFESVYHHHKVVTAETMVKEVLSLYFEQCTKHNQDISFSNILSWTDEIISEHWNKILSTETFDEDKIEEISERIHRIKCRKLYKRVAVFSIGNLHSSVKPQIKGPDDFIKRVILLKKDTESFTDSINDEYVKICKKLNKTIKEDTKYRFVFVKAQSESKDNIPIEDGNGSYNWSNKLFNINTVNEGKKSREDYKFFLLTDCIHRECAYLAFEKALYIKYKTSIDAQAAKCLKSDVSALFENKKKLFKDNYYIDALHLISDDMYFRKSYKALINHVVKKYEGFKVKDRIANEDSIKAFLRQFDLFELNYDELDMLLSGVLQFLLNGYYIDREAITKSAEEVWFRDVYNKDIHLCLVGKITDSASHYAYYLNDVIKYLKENNNSILHTHTSLSDCLKATNSGDPVFFYDDGSYSGKQIVGIFQEYMGIEVENRVIKESHVSVLTPDEREMLLDREIHLLFVVCNSQNYSYIKEEFGKLGLTNFKIAYQTDIHKSAFDKLENIEQRNILKEKLSAVGEQLISKRKANHGWSQERMKNAALGYNNSQQMVVCRENVPTYTVPAFWLDGEFNEMPWKSLFIRIDKPNSEKGDSSQDAKHNNDEQ